MRIRKNGAPTAAVRIPSGISMDVAPLAISSTSRRNVLPIRRDAGRSFLKSGPAAILAICGMISPTQPMRPPTATMEDVILSLIHILMSARGEEYDKLFGFELGIDDYVTKPFSPKELMARVNAVLNRTKARAKDTLPEVLSFSGLTIDAAGRSVTVDGKKIELTPKEYDLLF